MEAAAIAELILALAKITPAVVQLATSAKAAMSAEDQATRRRRDRDAQSERADRRRQGPARHRSAEPSELMRTTIAG
jgi:hypothetical protein